MTRRFLSLGIAIILGITALHAEGAAPVRSDVQQFVRAYVEAQNNADATATMEMVSRKPGVSSVTMGKVSRGWDAIRSEVDEGVGLQDHPKLVLGVIDVESLGPSYALAVAPFGASLPSTQGDLQVRGAITLVLEKSGSKWKVLHEHTSLEIPEMREGD